MLSSMFTLTFNSFSDHESTAISIVTEAVGSNMFSFSTDSILMRYSDGERVRVCAWVGPYHYDC